MTGEMPNQDPRLIDRVKDVFAVNKVTTPYEVDFEQKDSWAAWDFLSQFSRNEDGSITIEPVTYTLASDDNAITDNSYNQ
jgi:hypothetical protein